jgi:hypothetical protein
VKKPGEVIWGIVFWVVLIGGAYYLGVFSWLKSTVDYHRIAGKYDKEGIPGTIEFRSDGTLLEETLFATHKGTFKLLPDNRMEYEAEGLLWGTNQVILRWRFEGDSLVLSADSGSGLQLRCKAMN